MGFRLSDQRISVWDSILRAFVRRFPEEAASRNSNGLPKASGYESASWKSWVRVAAVKVKHDMFAFYTACRLLPWSAFLAGMRATWLQRPYEGGLGQPGFSRHILPVALRLVSHDFPAAGFGMSLHLQEQESACFLGLCSHACNRLASSGMFCSLYAAVLLSPLLGIAGAGAIFNGCPARCYQATPVVIAKEHLCSKGHCLRSWEAILELEWPP